MRPPLLGKHPVESNQFELQTPAIQELGIVLGNWMDCGTPGGVVTAPSRFGKSWAIRYFKNKPIDPKVPIVSVKIHRDTNLSQKQFYALLLEKFGHADPTSGTVMEIFMRLATFCQMLALEGSKSSIYIFIDDAQELSEENFSWICNLYDELYEEKTVQPCFVLFSEPKILGRLDSLRARARTQVIARLMTINHELKGVITSKDFKKCLEGYDEASEYPKGSGLHFSQYYFPEAFQRGWRLAKEAELFYQAFKQVYNKANLAWEFVIPMQYLVIAVKYALIAFKNSSAAFHGFSYEQLEKAVRFSGYINAGSFLSPPKRGKK